MICLSKHTHQVNVCTVCGSAKPVFTPENNTTDTILSSNTKTTTAKVVEKINFNRNKINATISPISTTTPSTSSSSNHNNNNLNSYTTNNNNNNNNNNNDNNSFSSYLLSELGL